MDVLIGIYFVIGAIWWAFRLGYARDCELLIIIAPVIVIFWPLDIAFGAGRGMRK